MSGATIPNTALIIRVLLLGGFLLLIPRITRKGLLFGAYVGEAISSHDTTRSLVSRWDQGCLTLMILSVLSGLGISAAGWPVTGNLSGTAFFLLGALALYLWVHSRARRLVSPAAVQQGTRALAPLCADKPKGAGVAKTAFGICVLASLATFAYTMRNYELLTGKPFITAVLAPSLNLLLSPLIALLAVFTAHAKRSIRDGSQERSFEAQTSFRAAMAYGLSCVALLLCAWLTFLSVQVIRVRLSEIDSRTLGIGILWMSAGVGGLFLVILLRLLKRFGQGGALLEAGAAEGSLTGGLADNSRWIGGLFYFDKSDPSIMVEKRFGFGYTLNYGNRTTIFILVAFSTLALTLVAICLVGEFL